uniref:Uncharacterized protein n=1 Tax=Octopus bimaculoides TaxID=37653 RepID=A0A0L8G746_OCTBM
MKLSKKKKKELDFVLNFQFSFLVKYLMPLHSFSPFFICIVCMAIYIYKKTQMFYFYLVIFYRIIFLIAKLFYKKM